MLPESALTQMYPVIMTPSHDGKYFHNYVLSLLNIVNTSAQNGWPLQVMMQRGESLITRARNNCVATFMAHPEWTHLFWIDSDIGFSAEAFYRLLLADKDVVAGIYPLKRENWPAEGVPAGTVWIGLAGPKWTASSQAAELLEPSVGQYALMPGAAVPVRVLSGQRNEVRRLAVEAALRGALSGVREQN